MRPADREVLNRVLKDELGSLRVPGHEFRVTVSESEWTMDVEIAVRCVRTFATMDLSNRQVTNAGVVAETRRELYERDLVRVRSLGEHVDHVRKVIFAVREDMRKKLVALGLLAPSDRAEFEREFPEVVG